MIRPPVNGTRGAGSKTLRTPPAKASIGKVRMPPGRFGSSVARKSSKARPKNKLKPRSRATPVREGGEMDTERTPKSRPPLAVRLPLSYIDGVNEQRAGRSV